MTRTLRKTTLPIVVAIMLLAGCSSDEQSSGDPVTIESQSNDEAGATTNYMACLDKNDDTDTWCKKHKSGTSANTN